MNIWRTNFKMNDIESEKRKLMLKNKKLNVMDSTATTLCMDNNIPIIVYNMNKTIISMLSSLNSKLEQHYNMVPKSFEEVALNLNNRLEK